MTYLQMYDNFPISLNTARFASPRHWMAISGVCCCLIFVSSQAVLADDWPLDKLSKARNYSRTLEPAAVVVIQHGKIVDQWGAIAMPLKCHSIRKSILSALFGLHVESGTIDLNATLKQLGT